MPIHSRPVVYDTLLRGYNNCPEFDALEKARQSSPEFVAKAADVATLAETLAELAGEEVTLGKWYLIYDPLFCAWSHGKPLLNGKVTLPMLDDIIATADWVTAHTFSHDKAGKLAGGNMVATLRDLFQAYVAPPPPPPAAASEGFTASPSPSIGPGELPADLRKFYLLSAHDTTLASLLAALPVTEAGGIPPYASSVVFELHITDTGAAYVSAFYNDAPLVFSGGICVSAASVALDTRSDACIVPLDAFLDATRDSFYDDWDAACGRETASSPSPAPAAGPTDAGTVAIILLLVCGVIGCVAGGGYWYHRRGSSRYHHMLGDDLFTPDALAVLEPGGRRGAGSSDGHTSFAPGDEL